MRFIKLISIIVLTLTCYEDSIKAYYFPISELSNGKVYKYECKQDSTKTQYWKLTSDLKNNMLTTEAYEGNFRKYELFKEKVTASGTEVTEFISYLKNSKGILIPIHKELVDVDVFKWETAEPYQYSANAQYDKYTKTFFSKKRTYIGKTKIKVLGKEYDAVKLKGTYKTVVLNSKEKFEYTQFSYYIKGIGLAKMEKMYADGTEEILELTAILSIDEWKNLKK